MIRTVGDGSCLANNHFSWDTYGLGMSLMPRFNYWSAVCPLAALLLYLTGRAVMTPFLDFAGYYFGSWELWQGNYQTVYETYALNQAIASQGYAGVFACYTPFPPFTALVMAPFLILPVAAAKIAFNLISAGLFLITVYRAGKFFGIPVWVVASIPVIFFIPLRNHMLLGQGYLLLTVLLVEGYMAYRKGFLARAGFLWAVAILFKVFPVCIVFLLVVRRQYKQLGYCVAFGAVLGMLSLWCVGFAAWKYYLFTLMPRLNNGELNDSYTFIFQSAFMLLKNLFVYDAVQNPGALLDNVYVFVIANIIYKAVVLGFAVGITLQKKVDDYMAFGVWVMAGILISPNGSSYSLILLLVPFMGWSGFLDRRKMWLLMGLLFLIGWLPVQWFAAAPVMGRFPRLYLMVVLFGLMIWFTGTRWMWKPVLAFMVVFVLADWGKFFLHTDNSRYLLSTASPLIYEFDVKQDRLVYYYWNNSGSHEVTTDLTVHSAEEIAVVNNQLVCNGKQLTQSRDFKKQALLVNGKQVVYLSDKNRGIGFYTLRVLDVK